MPFQSFGFGRLAFHELTTHTGMGIKAVSAPILASETAIRFWRGSFLLAWQLW